MNDYIALLRRNRNYRHLWLGAVVSQLGDWFNLIAVTSLVANLTDTGTAISGAFLTRFLPLFLFSPLAGVLADRYDRRYVMIASDLLRAATVLGFLFVRRPEHIWILYALTVLQFALSAVFTPARSAVLSNIVNREELVAANALDSLTWSTMLALGAFLGGVAAAFLGIAQSFIIDAATFVVSALLISRISRPVSAPITQTVVRRAGGWLDFLDGLRYLRGQPFILGISLVKGAGSLAWGAINVLEVSFAEEIFPLSGTGMPSFLSHVDGGTATLGIIYFVSGLGTGLGPLLLRRWLGDAPLRMRWAVSAGFALLTLGIWWLSLAPTLGLFAVGTFIRTFGSGTIWVFSAALLQTIAPDRYRGRVFAFEFAFLTLTQSIATLWAGLAQDSLGWSVRQTAASMGFVALFTGSLWLLFHLRHLFRPALADQISNL
ncbi:MAG: MFS transporter [Chloroflexi bacterium]|nr:MFS transporter [Chloroflexota bacterium]MCI0579697.1 MFS transporter [Chloroflexota bacterium]MCI0650050.1 MFS transporter [Chloroflexota bacterium]MCI0727011.1 MFS transporter [Chloroflexota bacterium]